MKNIRSVLYCTGITIALLISASLVGHAFRAIGFPETNIVIVYLFCVLLTSRLTRGYVFGIIASVLATVAFNYFFAKPNFAFSVDASDYIITFIIMTITALVTSTLTSHAKQSELEALEKAMETKALYTLTNRLTEAEGLNQIVEATISTIREFLNTQVAFIFYENKNVSNTTEFYDWPIHGKEIALGIMRISKKDVGSMNEAQIRLLRSMIENATLAMDRYWAAQQRTKYNKEIAQERYRGTLLRSISHDLRTPLSGMMGTLEMLMDMTPKEDPRYSLALDIHKDANWLHSMVENILNLTRLQDGKLIIKKQEEAVEEIVGVAVGHISRRSPEYEIKVDVPAELLLVPMDGKLIEQVIINLLDNAIKHTPPQNEISILVTEDKKGNNAVFSISDRGTGISEEDLPNIFQMFYTTCLKHADADHGIGLGLAICDAIIKAHGGHIKAQNRVDEPGAEFIFTLPLEAEDYELL